MFLPWRDHSFLFDEDDIGTDFQELPQNQTMLFSRKREDEGKKAGKVMELLKKMQKLERACYLDLEEKRVMLTALRLACCSCRMFLLIWMFDFECSSFFMC